MSRKSVELWLLLIVAGILTYFDPLSLTGDGQFHAVMFAAVIYAFPSAFLVLLVTKIAYWLLLSSRS